MTHPDPAAVLSGIQTGNICDSCNRSINHGEKAGMYATWYEYDGWVPRRTWCLDCCPEAVEPGTEDADEAILVGVLFGHRLLSLKVKNRSPKEA